MGAKAEICELCGSRESDWVDVETGRPLDKPKLTPIGIRDHGCSEIASYRKGMYPDGVPDGIRVVLVPYDDVDQNGRLIRR